MPHKELLHTVHITQHIHFLPRPRSRCTACFFPGISGNFSCLSVSYNLLSFNIFLKLRAAKGEHGYLVSCCASALCEPRPARPFRTTSSCPAVSGHSRRHALHRPFPSCPAPTGHHSFFNASAGFVRMRWRAWRVTVARVTSRTMASAAA